MTVLTGLGHAREVPPNLGRCAANERRSQWRSGQRRVTEKTRSGPVRTLQREGKALMEIHVHERGTKPLGAMAVLATMAEPVGGRIRVPAPMNVDMTLRTLRLDPAKDETSRARSGRVDRIEAGTVQCVAGLALHPLVGPRKRERRTCVRVDPEGRGSKAIHDMASVAVAPPRRELSSVGIPMAGRASVEDRAHLHSRFPPLLTIRIVRMALRAFDIAVLALEGIASRRMGDEVEGRGPEPPESVAGLTVLGIISEGRGPLVRISVAGSASLEGWLLSPPSQRGIVALSALHSTMRTLQGIAGACVIEIRSRDHLESVDDMAILAGRSEATLVHVPMARATLGGRKSL